MPKLVSCASIATKKPARRTNHHHMLASLLAPLCGPRPSSFRRGASPLEEEAPAPPRLVLGGTGGRPAAPFTDANPLSGIGGPESGLASVKGAAGRPAPPRLVLGGAGASSSSGEAPRRNEEGRGQQSGARREARMWWWLVRRAGFLVAMLAQETNFGMHPGCTDRQTEERGP